MEYRTLDRNISIQYYHRLLMSQNKEEVATEMHNNTAALSVDKLEFIKSPMVAEFMGLSYSSTEQDFAFILENDSNVIRWLRPAPKQFHIYWANNSKRYEPEFIVETEDAIYMIETKAANEIEDADVLAKKEAAVQYCNYATEYTM